MHYVSFRQAVAGFMTLGLIGACSAPGTTAAADPPRSTDSPNSTEDETETGTGSGTETDAGTSHSSKDASSPDSADAGAPADASPHDPLCDSPFHRITTDDHGAQADALVVPFAANMALGATFGSPANGRSPPRWFAFDITTTEVVDLSFSGPKAEAIFYFQTETESRFGLWFVHPTKSAVSLEPGRWFVKLADDAPLSAANGSTVELDFKWSSPPAACAGK